ncbi:RICIN domain-containing protein [Streptomyces sp. NPDC020965]|uniref:RICIN domain-containing protein n=1 Tax=Streptomyces sp. NPDC020965 TaxID=3365105 RepID=UPI0037B725C7
MRTGTRRIWGAGAVAVTAGAALALGTLNPAAATTEERSAERAITVQQVTLRLASDPSQVANVRGGSNENGAPIIQWRYTNAANERWEPEAAGGGHFRFKSLDSGKCLNVRGGGNENGAQIIQWPCGSAANEQWRFVRKGIGYQIVARSSAKCLNVAGGVGQGRQLIQYSCTTDGATNDVWLPVWESSSR